MSLRIFYKNRRQHIREPDLTQYKAISEQKNWNFEKNSHKFS
jgi:hypothetical protein